MDIGTQEINVTDAANAPKDMAVKAPLASRGAARKRATIMIGSAALVLVAVYCTLGAAASSLLPSVAVADTLPILALTAVATTVLTTLLRGKGALLCLALIMLAMFYMMPAVASGGRWALFSASSEINKYFDIKVLFIGADAMTREINLFLTFAAMTLMVPVSITICLRHSHVGTMLMTLPILFPLLMLNENSPSLLYVIGLIAAYLILLICALAYPNDYEKRSLAVLPSATLAAVLLLLTYAITLPGSGTRSDFARRIEGYIRSFSHSTGSGTMPGIGWPASIADGWSFDTDKVAVSDAGARTITGEEVLAVASSIPGTFYLRGYSMQNFDGRSWFNTADTQANREFSALMAPAAIVRIYGHYNPQEALTPASMTIESTGDISGMMYYPYYYTEYGATDNRSRSVYFLYTDAFIPDLAATLPPGESISLGDFNAWVQSFYTIASESTASELRRIAEQADISANENRAVIAGKVAEFVSSSAQYTLSPPVTPVGEDFAVYFLETARRGYCIHFATAATLMLRALDVPARFTSGFAVTVPESGVGELISITDGAAHAWVEVYYDDVGWIPLEVSPSSRENTTAGQYPFYLPSWESNLRDDLQSFDDRDSSASEEMPSDPPSQQPETTDRDAAVRDYAAIRKNAIIIVTACAIAFIALLFVNSHVIRSKRAKELNQPDTNAAILYAWRYILNLCRRSDPPDGMAKIEDIALKARFSNHRMTEDECAAAVRFAYNFSEQIKKQSNPFKRLYIKHIRGLI